MEGWAEFVDEMKQYYNVDLGCLSGGGRRGWVHSRFVALGAVIDWAHNAPTRWAVAPARVKVLRRKQGRGMLAVSTSWAVD